MSQQFYLIYELSHEMKSVLLSQVGRPCVHLFQTSEG